MAEHSSQVVGWRSSLRLSAHVAGGAVALVEEVRFRYLRGWCPTDPDRQFLLNLGLSTTDVRRWLHNLTGHAGHR